MRKFILSLIALCVPFSSAHAEMDVSPNQTPTISPIYPGSLLPFKVTIEQTPFTLPAGVHSYASAIYKGKWLILAGRTNGLHGFDNGDNNFPPSQQNSLVFVVDPDTGRVWYRSLYDPSSNLSQEQIDVLTVTSPQSYQTKRHLYITGGYGVDTNTGLFSTKDTLTSIDIKGLIHWVIKPAVGETAKQSIRTIRDPIFRITGGYMDRSVYNLTLLIFGQNFQGFYTDGANGLYSRQVRKFKIHDDGKNLSVKIKSSSPSLPDPSYRRRDLNVVPVMQKFYGLPLPGFVAFSGVFTEQTGIWTVPVFIDYKGNPSMDNPASASTFKQGMNNYVCPNVGLFSEDNGLMYVILPGGISYGYFDNGVFKTDTEFPFINQVTTITMDKHGAFLQYIMENEYPVILSTGTNPGNQLLFGAGAGFFLKDGVSTFKNGVIKLDSLPNGAKVVGYIVGGIMSTLPNTNTREDSAASPYIFKVIIEPNPPVPVPLS